MMTKFIFSVKVACILCCAALWSVNSNAQNYRTGYGEWYKEYFLDEFGDPMYEHPYIQCYLKQPNSSYSSAYFNIQFFIFRNTPTFQIHIQESGYTINLYDKTTIKIKSANGKISTIPVSVSNNEAMMLIGESAIRFAKLINSGNYGLVVSTYSDTNATPEKWAFSCYNETKDIIKAAKSAVGYSFTTY